MRNHVKGTSSSSAKSNNNNINDNCYLSTRKRNYVSTIFAFATKNMTSD